MTEDIVNEHKHTQTTPIFSITCSFFAHFHFILSFSHFANSNKSPEWPTPSAEKTNTDSSTCDNYSKAASIGNTTISSSNEWVKTNQAAPKVPSEIEHKGKQFYSIFHFDVAIDIWYEEIEMSSIGL